MTQRNDNHGRLVGRAAQVNPPNRFESTHQVDDLEHLEGEAEATDRRVETQFLPDATQSIFSKNNSPDIPFNYSINPYRGCEHGCAYCYARPGHEFLGMNAGLDFESKILVKHNAADLLRDELNRPTWQPEVIAMSGVTDCYQPAERRFRLTRSLLEVLLEARQPLGIVTKNALVLRDLDLLAEMAQLNLVAVNISLTSLDQELTRQLEPRTSSPAARLRAMRELSAAGVPVRVMAAPIIPGLNDFELPHILQAAAEAGASGAALTVLRLPLAVEPIFLDWLATKYPEKLELVQSRIRQTRDGKLSDSQFGSRMRGKGEIAEQINKMFKVFSRKYDLDRPLPPLNCDLFVPPVSSNGQKRLF